MEKFIVNILMELIINFYYTALHFAAENNNTEMFKLLLSTPGIDINLKAIVNQIF